jgi:uncharacterized protein YegP (UPF0339 family)
MVDTKHHGELFRDEAEEFRWRRVADNGNTTATSGEGYKNKLDATEQFHTQFPLDKLLDFTAASEEGEDTVG